MIDREKINSLQPPSVSIVIPVSIPDNIKECLQSLRKTNYSNLEIIITVNNSSHAVVTKITADIKETAEKFPRDIRFKLITKCAALGYAAACNIGFRASTGQYVIFLNDDVVVSPNLVSELVKIVEEEDDIACVQPKILSRRNLKMFDYAGAAGGFIDIYGIPFCAGRIFDVIEEDRCQYDDIKDIFWACGVALFCRRAVLDEIGLFDEEFFSYMEEIDLAFRVLLRGYRIVFAPKAEVHHLGSATTTKLNVNRDYLNYRNNFLMLLKNYDANVLLGILAPRFFLDMINFLTRLHQGNARLAMNIPRAYSDLLTRKLKHALRERASVRGLRKVNSNYLRKRTLTSSIAILYKIGGVRYFQQVRDLMPCVKEE